MVLQVVTMVDHLTTIEVVIIKVVIVVIEAGDEADLVVLISLNVKSA